MKLYPLTKPQNSIWSMEQYFGGSIANISGSVIFKEPVDVIMLKDAIAQTVKQHDSIRIRIKIQDGSPMQYIKPYMSYEPHFVNFDTKDEFDSWIYIFARTPFYIDGDLYKFVIFTIGQMVGYVLQLHHITADAWTFSLLVDTVTKNLKGEIDSSVNSYMDYLVDEQKYEVSARREKDKAYFFSCFERCNEPVYLNNRQARNADSDHTSLAINSVDTKRILEFCAKHNLSPYALFMSTLALYIYRIKGGQNLYIGTAILNRFGKKEKATAGMFVNTVPILLHINETQSIIKNAQDNAENIMGVFRHQKYQYRDLLMDIRKQYDFTGRLYDVVLNYQNAVLPEGVTAQWHFSGSQGESLNIHINDRQREGAFHLDYTYQTELFTQHDIEQLHEHWLNLIFDMIENPSKKPHELKLLSNIEYQKVVFDFNETTIEYPKDKCIYQLFENMTAENPHNVAIIFENIKYSYHQINSMANSLAHILREKGVGRNDVVAIIAKRSYKIVIAMLAILKAGGAYMPIDPDFSEERIAFMLDEAKCKVLLVFEATLAGANENVESEISNSMDRIARIDRTNSIKSKNIEIIDMADEKIFSGSNSNLENINTSQDLCYVIFTSGSTGTPKGVMVAHFNFVNFCDNNANNQVQSIIVSDCKSFFCLGEFIFDMASAEVFLALLNNRTIVLPNENQLGDPEKLATLMEEHYVEFILTTPTRVLAYLNNDSYARAMRHIKVLSLGGESLTQDTISTFKMHTNAKILNGYGPAETTQGCSWSWIDSDTSIGRPIANTQIYILDKWQNPLPVGATGELYVSGDGVGIGYLNRSNLTAEKFVINPFTEDKRMYKTGDLAHWNADGYLEFVGRIDHQVKIRGMRIELGEIETALSRFEGINNASVAVKEDGKGQQFICAYYIGNDIDIKSLKQFLAKTLPQYMVPHFFISMEMFPVTLSGKTDLNAFPTPDFANIQTGVEYVAPATDGEKTIALLMEKVLNIQKIGANDNFFDLGGDSLKAIELVSKAHYEDMHFNLQDVFENSTPNLLAKYIANGVRPAINYNAEEFAEIHKFIGNKDNKAINKVNGNNKQSLGNVLITGATGWLGVHILDAFLSNETGKAYCLVRGTNLTDGSNKLKATLTHYFGNQYINNDTYNDTFDGRIIPICGDIVNMPLINDEISTVFHSAAIVKHYGTYQQSYDVNVLGTENIIAFAKEKKAKLIHISTASVSGNSQTLDFPQTIFDETSLFIGQNLENVYIRSKFEAEISILKAKLEGLEAAIVRVGNLTNRYSDLVFQKNYQENATLTRLKAFVALEMFPQEMALFPIEFSPVDDTAKSIIKLTQYFDNTHSIFHAYHHNPCKFEDFVKAIQSTGIKMKAVETKKFVQAIYEAGTVPETAHIHKAFIHDISADGKLGFHSNIKLNNDFTTNHLARIGFAWNQIDDIYLEKYVQYFKNINYWEEKK